MIATVPPGFYSAYSDRTFHLKLQLNANQFYRISLRDSFGDGMKDYVAVYRGKALLSNLIMMDRNFHDEARTDFKRLDHAIFTGENPPEFLHPGDQGTHAVQCIATFSIFSVVANEILGISPPSCPPS